MSSYRIGTAARLSGLPVATLRNWELRYGLVIAQRTQGGQRLYSPADVERLSVLKRLVDQGLSAGEAHNVLRQRLRGQLPARESSRVREDARRVRREVAESHARVAADYQREYERLTALVKNASGERAEWLRRQAEVARAIAERRRRLARPGYAAAQPQDGRRG